MSIGMIATYLLLAAAHFLVIYFLLIDVKLANDYIIFLYVVAMAYFTLVPPLFIVNSLIRKGLL